MNIVYAVKIFVALSIVAGITRLVCGRGLSRVLTAKDLSLGWRAIIGTLVVCCFSVRVELFFVTLAIWSLILASMLRKDNSGRLAAYALLCCISPPMFVQIGHFGPLNDLLHLTPFRLFAIVLLIPEMLRLLGRRDAPKTPSWLTLCDAATVIYALYWLIRHFGGGSVTALGREALGQALDSLIPYYVLTRALVATDVRHRFLAFLLLGATYQAMVGMAESLSRHLLYAQLQWLYGVGWGQSVGLMRGAWLRAEAAFPGPLMLSVLSMFAIGVWFALKRPVKDRAYLLVVLTLTGGLLATYGRGPILAGLLLFASAWMLKRITAKRYLFVIVIGAIVVGAGWSAGIGDAVTTLLGSAPGADERADFNVRYRQELLTMSLALLKQSPWWGVPNFLEQLAVLKQGEGIIDLVNTYLVLALNSGAFGLGLVMLPYIVSLWREAGRAVVNLNIGREGYAWLALTIAFMAAIFTVSPVSIIQILMVWTVAIALARLQDTNARVPVASEESPRAPVQAQVQFGLGR